MANTDLAVRIASIFDAAGIKKAEKAIGSLDDRAKRLGRTLGVSLGAAAVVAFGKKAVDAFAADEKAATQLNLAIKNLGLGFASANVTKFISDLEKSASVADDELRPAFQALLTTTGSLTKSQELLNLAIETSRGSGVDLVQTSQDIANAYVGNTKGLKKYYLGLTQAELKTASFAEIQAKLNEQFSGSNAAYLNTTAGQFEAISVAAGNASEVIGGSLVNAFILASGSNGIEDLISKIDTLSQKIAGVIEGSAKLIFSIKAMFNPKYWKTGGSDQIWKDWDKLMAARKNASARPYDPANNSVTGYKVDRAAQLKAERDAKARAKAIVDAQKKNTAELKKQAALKKAQGIFDLEKIQVIAALQGKISEDEKLRLQLQLALLMGNDDYAKKLSEKLAASQLATGNLAVALKDLPTDMNPFKDWVTDLDKTLQKLREIAAFNATGGSTGRGDVFPTLTPTVQDLISTPSSGRAGSTAAGDVYITVNGSVLSDQDLIAAVQNGLQLNSLSGKPSDIGRIAGMFG